MYICNVRINKQRINNKKIVMMNQVNNSQSTAAVNSAISNIFSKKSVLDFAVYAYNKMVKSPTECSGKISVVVGDGYCLPDSS